MSEAELTCERLRRIVDYDAGSGIFTWRKRDESEFQTVNAHRTWNTRYAGKRAGCPMPHGYRKIAIDNLRHYEHRLAWLYVTGEWPSRLIDHINQDPADNRFINLRLADKRQNAANAKQRSDNSTGARGVTLHNSGRYLAQIQDHNGHRHLGLFRTVEEASEAYRVAAARSFGEFSKA